MELMRVFTLLVLVTLVSAPSQGFQAVFSVWSKKAAPTLAVYNGAVRWSSGNYARSCKEYLDGAGAGVDSGLYWIDPQATSSYVRVYCDMTSNGGGWTMIVAQFEADPVTNWNEGTQGDYDPSLATSKGFALSTTQIPAHTHVGFGQDLNANHVDYVSFTYSTGDIATTTLAGAATGNSYKIHRTAGGYFDWHNPDGGSYNADTLAGWHNTLTLNKGPGNGFNWQFSPHIAGNSNRGYGIAGANLQGVSNPFAWTLWVR